MSSAVLKGNRLAATSEYKDKGVRSKSTGNKRYISLSCRKIYFDLTDKHRWRN